MHYINKAGLVLFILGMFMISDNAATVGYALIAVGVIAFFVDL